MASRLLAEAEAFLGEGRVCLELSLISRPPDSVRVGLASFVSPPAKVGVGQEDKRRKTLLGKPAGMTPVGRVKESKARRSGK